MDDYILGAKVSRRSFHKGVSFIFVQKYFPFSVINIEKFCKDKQLEACALILDVLCFKVCIITVYRSLNGNFQYFIKILDNIINKIYKPGIQLIICDDININYPTESKEKQKLNNILNSYNLVNVINFPTRIKHNSRSATDNIFIDTTQFGMYATCSLVNGLSDHDAQMLELHAVNLNSNRNAYKTTTIRKIVCNAINDFKDKLSDKLSDKLWQNVF
jgi:hypothetical protein